MWAGPAGAGAPHDQAFDVALEARLLLRADRRVRLGHQDVPVWQSEQPARMVQAGGKCRDLQARRRRGMCAGRPAPGGGHVHRGQHAVTRRRQYRVRTDAGGERQGRALSAGVQGEQAGGERGGGGQAAFAHVVRPLRKRFRKACFGRRQRRGDGPPLLRATRDPSPELQVPSGRSGHGRKTCIVSISRPAARRRPACRTRPAGAPRSGRARRIRVRRG